MHTPATPDGSLVAGASQRFESARRLSLLPIDKPNTRNEEALGDLRGLLYITATSPRWGDIDP